MEENMPLYIYVSWVPIEQWPQGFWMHRNVLANSIFRLWSERQPGLEIKKPTIWFFLLLDHFFPLQWQLSYKDHCGIPACYYRYLWTMWKHVYLCDLVRARTKSKNMQKPVNDVESKPKRPTQSEMPPPKMQFFVMLFMFVASQTNLSCIFLSKTSQSK